MLKALTLLLVELLSTLQAERLDMLVLRYVFIKNLNVGECRVSVLVQE